MQMLLEIGAKVDARIYQNINKSMNILPKYIKIALKSFENR